MTIRLAKPKGIPAIHELLAQILNLHYQLWPDIFEIKRGKNIAPKFLRGAWPILTSLFLATPTRKTECFPISF
ncbi:hypothetical protein [Streptococcus mutans]|uniref:hypothetical protein n=1 Tax=Streptococcus mutans TaxID=1309 RepID=UPI001455855D|nr:hypothetical protein [Streptococcus mutans]NLR04949.1 hypothetical protein [Streptococcus mutans]